MTALQEWLSYAPTPTQLNTDQRWHVFISYRSVNRYWVLELYNILHQLGYSVFLDQYVLSAAAPLALTLGEELDASASAVMVWSNSYEIPSGARTSSITWRGAKGRPGGSDMSLRNWTEQRYPGSRRARYLWISPSGVRGPAGAIFFGCFTAWLGSLFPKSCSAGRRSR